MPLLWIEYRCNPIVLGALSNFGLELFKYVLLEEKQMYE